MPTFTLDTFTKNLPLWEKILDEPYKNSFVNERTNILDIGVGEGPSTIWFAETLINHPKSKVYSVDGWWQKETERRFDFNIADSSWSHRVIKMKGSVPHILCELAIKETGWTKFKVIHYNYTTNSIDALNIISMAFTLLLKDDGVLVINNYDSEHKINLLGGIAVHYKEALLFLQRLYAGKFEVLSSDKLLVLKKLAPEQIL